MPRTPGNVVVWRDDRSGTMESFWTTMLRAGKHCRCRREAQQRRTVVRLRSLTRETRSVDATASLRQRDCGHNERKKIEDSGHEARCSSSNSQHDAMKWPTYHGSIATVLRGSHENVQSWQPQGVHDVTTLGNFSWSSVGPRLSLSAKLCTKEKVTTGPMARRGATHGGTMATLQLGRATKVKMV